MSSQYHYNITSYFILSNQTTAPQFAGKKLISKVFQETRRQPDGSASFAIIVLNCEGNEVVYGDDSLTGRPALPAGAWTDGLVVTDIFSQSLHVSI